MGSSFEEEIGTVALNDPNEAISGRAAGLTTTCSTPPTTMGAHST
jgi:hypothetical protein